MTSPRTGVGLDGNNSVLEVEDPEKESSNKKPLDCQKPNHLKANQAPSMFWAYTLQ